MELLQSPTTDCANPSYKQFGGVNLFAADYSGQWTLYDVVADNIELQYFKVLLSVCRCASRVCDVISTKCSVYTISSYL